MSRERIGGQDQKGKSRSASCAEQYFQKIQHIAPLLHSQLDQIALILPIPERGIKQRHAIFQQEGLLGRPTAQEIRARRLDEEKKE